eukprot:TRINITY_DN5631_c0_g1_i7.p1 TRINITY_DN5631_c0_g1~~TRINITY_DN5631_c0_g1_i7.p1  ORF type:complete len:602 (-),score=33.84 TRINITY_DN5631_c0_g1_i7:231-2036(-)
MFSPLSHQNKRQETQTLSKEFQQNQVPQQQMLNITQQEKEEGGQQLRYIRSNVASNLNPLSLELSDKYIENDSVREQKRKNELICTQNSISISFGMRDESIEKTSDRKELDTVDFEPRIKDLGEKQNDKYTISFIKNVHKMQQQSDSNCIEDVCKTMESFSPNNSNNHLNKSKNIKENVIAEFSKFTNMSSSYNKNKSDDMKCTIANDNLDFQTIIDDKQFDDQQVQNNLHLLYSTEAVAMVFGDTLSDAVESPLSYQQSTLNTQNNSDNGHIVVNKKKSKSNVNVNEKRQNQRQKGKNYSPTILQPIDEQNEYNHNKSQNKDLESIQIQHGKSCGLLQEISMSNSYSNQPSLTKSSNKYSNLSHNETQLKQEERNSRSEYQADEREINPVLFSDNFMICVESESLQDEKQADDFKTVNQKILSKPLHVNIAQDPNMSSLSPTIQSVLSSTSSCSNPEPSDTDTWTLPDCQPLKQTHVAHTNLHNILDLQSKVASTRLRSMRNSNMDDIDYMDYNRECNLIQSNDIDNTNVVASFDMSMQFHQRIEEKTQNQVQNQTNLLTVSQRVCGRNCCVFMFRGKKIKSQKMTLRSWFKKGKRSRQN